MQIKFSIVLFLLFQILLHGAQSDIKIINSNSSSIVIDYTPAYIGKNQITINNRDYLKIDLKYGFIINENSFGLPAEEVRLLNVAVPAEFGNTIQILSSEYEYIDGKLSPICKPDYKNGNVSFNYTENYSGFATNENLVEFGDFGNTRGLFSQTIIVRPIKYDNSTNKIKLYKKIRFQINFSSNNNLSFSADNKLNGTVINYDQAEKWNKPTTRLNKTLTDSPLSQGKWFKVEITDEGIYKIDKTILQNLGIDLTTLDPRTLKIYNNGGYSLSENPELEKPNTLLENAIFVEGESDGKFDNTDYVLFYGRGVNFWEYNKTSEKILRNRHYYSKLNYYFLTYGGNTGKRMSSEGDSFQSGTVEQTVTKGFEYLEENKVNLLKAGRMSFGDEFSSAVKSRTYITTLANRIDNTPIVYNFQVVNFSTVKCTLKVSEGDTQIFSNSLYGATGWYSYGELHSGAGSFTGTIAENRSLLNFNFNITSASAKAYLDYFEIEYQKLLKTGTDELIFFSKDTTAKISYKPSNFTNSEIYAFDVTDFMNVKKINATISASELSFSKNETVGNVSKYLALCSTKFRTPGAFTAVVNSNISGNTDGYEYIILTNKTFSEQAQKLADYRNNTAPNKITTTVVYIDDLLNEINCGVLDPTAIRDYLKYVYTNWNTKPFYVLLFGDGDYDYLNFEGYSTNFIPTYQTEGSLNEVYSYPTDDYYGRLVGGISDKKVDLAIGRIPIRTQNEGNVIIEKIINYENNTDRGLWQNNITLVADDGLTSTSDDGDLHSSQSERLANDYIPQFFDLNKIYLAAYPTVITGLGRRKPAVTEAIINAVNNGTLILNYIGHGNPDVWAHEYVLERASTIPLFKNDKLFFLTAATCDFGKYDDPAIQSATEDMLFMPSAGMIGGFSACRAVVSGENAALNNLFYSHIFEDELNSELPNTIGNAYFQTKQLRYQQNDEKFHLFAEPVLRLAQPLLPVSIDSINGNNLSTNVQLSAFGKAKINGSVRDGNGNIQSGFNGEGILTVFDSEKLVYLSDIKMNMKVQGGVIFRGRVSIENGKFATSFTVPKDISYENKSGKVTSYIYNSTIDGIGFTKSITIGGTDSTIIDDKKGPDIEIHFDDISFNNAKLVNPDFALLVNLYDETGLNTTGSGIGHKLEGLINDDEENPVDLTNFFIGDLDSGGKSGLINYKFSNQTPGEYKIAIKAWDVFNNFASQESYFTVVDGGGLTVKDVVNYPNPFSYSTTFTFQHNLTKSINVKIKIYTIAGRLIKEIEEKDVNERFVKIDWDGKDEDNNKIANGTYLYKLVVETIDGDYQESILGKLAIIK